MYQRFFFARLIVLLLGFYLAACSRSEKDTESASNQNNLYPTNTSLLTDTHAPEEGNVTSTHIDANGIDFGVTVAQHNKAAYITSQCYTKTEDAAGAIRNPCFSCHINAIEPNYINDPDLQQSYAMSDYSRINRFTNLFKERSGAVAMISDDMILNYVRQDNYLHGKRLLLAEKLQDVSTVWDVNENGKWDGYIPDCYFSFDSEGFDRDAEGHFTGWRAFGYYPFLGTFWPTNGSMDDVLIRLPEVFRLNDQGDFNLTVYKVNLAIVESLIKKEDTVIAPVNESTLGVDLDQDGNLSTASLVKYYWVKPDYNLTSGKLTNFSMSYVGKAKALLLSNEQLIAPGLYPKGTEFLHSVRYLDVDADGSIQMAPRMKELRYGRKSAWNSYPELQNAAMSEIMEKDLFPERLRNIQGSTEEGLQTGLGWVYQGFIEDKEGELRPQNYEETLYCIGCHSGIGAIADSTFVFRRKFDHTHLKNGWYHWTQDPNGLKNIAEPKTRDGRDEYSLYLEENHAGDEFRDNTEAMEKFFDKNGSLKSSEVDLLRNDISHLLLPSRERALELNKAYKVIVEEQSYIYGRDAHVKPVTNVHREVEVDQPTGITSPVVYEK